MCGSIKINQGDTHVVYPPASATDCNCLYCQMARHVAEYVCPTCQQPLGFDAVLPLRLDSVLQTHITYGPERQSVHFYVHATSCFMIFEHRDCYEQRQQQRAAERAAADATLQPVPPKPDNPPIDLTLVFYDTVTADPTGALARLYLFSDLLPDGVHRDDPRLPFWKAARLAELRGEKPERDLPKKKRARKDKAAA